MSQKTLSEIADKLVLPPKGILAADESEGTIKKRFDDIGIESNIENRCNYREMLFTTPEIEKYISGVILFDETVWQKINKVVLIPSYLSQRGILPGIKVDEGKEPFSDSPNEFVTKGLDGLSDRLPKYVKAGCVFTKWRAVATIGDSIPTDEAIQINAEKLAEFALISQSHKLVPIVEPEVLMDGNHSIEKCEEVSIKFLSSVFSNLKKKKVNLKGILLKTNMIVQGKDLGDADANLVAIKTLSVLKKCVPEEIPGIVFLSGGLSPETATLYLNEINKNKNLPWRLSFSFGRALQKPALFAWSGDSKNVILAQNRFKKRAMLNSLATQGLYRTEMEKE